MANESRLQNGALSSTQVGAYNVYTGARYVPLIAGQWDSTKNYEPLKLLVLPLVWLRFPGKIFLPGIFHNYHLMRALNLFQVYPFLMY